MGLSSEILEALKELQFETPTDIQKQAIPRLLGEDRDFIGLAQTGTGKTAAFGLPLLDLLDPSENMTQGLILAPTRELGKQIAHQLTLFSSHMPKINVLVVYGGSPIQNQIKALKKTQHVIIATPGRLIDLINRKAVKLNNLKYLVLDEADEMLNMGFKDELDEILSYTPDEKQTWLFSATMPSAIRKIVKKYMDDPIDVQIKAKTEVNENIEHLYTIVKQRNKTEALMRFLDIHGQMRGVVFCRTRRDTQELAERLLQKGYKADALHGDLSQAQRDRVMGRFRSNELQVLIATDVAARGIDVQDLTHVFHFSLPDEIAYYTHRSGRTARAGKEGTSIAFISKKEKYRIAKLQRTLSISFEKVMVPEVDQIAEIRLTNWAMDFSEINPLGKVDKKLSDHVQLLLGNISKEDLISKLLVQELGRLNLGTSKDLNEFDDGSYDKKKSGKSRNHRDRPRRGRRGSRSFNNRDRKKNKKSDKFTKKVRNFKKKKKAK